jgi:putative copper resistance protein D
MRAVAAAEQARPMAAIIDFPPWLVAPDFVYRSTAGQSNNLKDHRGKSIVLLVLFTLPQSEPRLDQLTKLSGSFKDVEILAVPWNLEKINARDRRWKRLPIVTDGSQEIFEVYALFRRSLSAEGTLPDPPVPPHMEFLIDRQGYIRARWIPGEGVTWTNTELFLKQINLLREEKPAAPAPDEHVH